MRLFPAITLALAPLAVAQLFRTGSIAEQELLSHHSLLDHRESLPDGGRRLWRTKSDMAVPNTDRRLSDDAVTGGFYKARPNEHAVPTYLNPPSHAGPDISTPVPGGRVPGSAVEHEAPVRQLYLRRAEKQLRELRAIIHEFQNQVERPLFVLNEHRDHAPVAEHAALDAQLRTARAEKAQVGENLVQRGRTMVKELRPTLDALRRLVSPVGPQWALQPTLKGRTVGRASWDRIWEQVQTDNGAIGVMEKRVRSLRTDAVAGWQKGRATVHQMWNDGRLLYDPHTFSEAGPPPGKFTGGRLKHPHSPVGEPKLSDYSQAGRSSDSSTSGRLEHPQSLIRLLKPPDYSQGGLLSGMFTGGRYMHPPGLIRLLKPSDYSQAKTPQAPQAPGSETRHWAVGAARADVPEREARAKGSQLPRLAEEE